MRGLYLFFTAEGIRAELTAEVSVQAEKWEERWNNDPYGAMYDYGMLSPEEESAAGRYVHTMVDTFLRKLTDFPELEIQRGKVKVALTDDDITQLLQSLPFAVGAEYVNRPWIVKMFKGLNDVFKREIKEYNGTVALYLEEKHQNLRVPERVFFHLVENKKDEQYPFAFIATYATRDNAGKVGHYPLKYALTEYAGNRQKLLDLLNCLNNAAEVAPLIGEFMENGELFHPLRLDKEEAYQFLKSVPAIESTGILCRIPNWWKTSAATPKITIELGGKKPAALGTDTLISMVPGFTVDGVDLSKGEVEELLRQTEGLALLKGKWVEVNHSKLKSLLEQIDSLGGDLTLLQTLKMNMETGEGEDGQGITVQNGAWLTELLHKLRNPKGIPGKTLPGDFHAKLRPYQKTGFQWLDYMSELGFGACLADDMGLGKTIQVLAYLDTLRKEEPDAKCLLIVPASLLGNWQKEAEKFTPELPVEIFHGRAADIIASDLETRTQDSIPFLSVTTYGMASRVDFFRTFRFRCLILDEAQAIKNPGTKQTRMIKAIHAGTRIAMTGTPIENDLTNLWSLFDFLNTGLLGTPAEFKKFTKTLDSHPENYEKLRAMISPFLLRRMKTDKSIIKDLPDKIEILDYSELSAKQIVLYRKVVSDLENSIEDLTGIGRRGTVLATITKLKQICNHPDQYLDGESYVPEESGKMELLREICETIREKRERVLVFTQFREIIPHLEAYMTNIFGRRGYVLHGSTPVKERSEIVDAFQSENYVPFLILSLKAGGSGLNLTKASHVIHFDRWWNPAVENQATDRTYRIGQKSNVMVHKLVCRNTIEEKIDSIINSKKELAENVIGSNGESWITELSNDQLLNLLRLG